MHGLLSRVGALSACGFGLSKAVASIGYLSAMGSVDRSVGFVTELWFMAASEVTSLVLAALVIVFASKGRAVRERFVQWPAVVAAVVGFSLGGLGLLSWAPVAVSATVLGVCYAFVSVVFSLTWIEELSRQDPHSASVSMVAGLFIQVVAVACAATASVWVLVPVALAAAFGSAVCYARLRALPHDEDGPCSGLGNASERPAVGAVCGQGATPKAFAREFGNAYLCLFVLVGVVGILHTSVLGSASEHIVGDVAMWVPLCAATFIAAAVAVFALRSPDPTLAYRICLPVMLVLLSLLPFLGDTLGPLTGAVMIACNDVVGMLFLFYIVAAAHRSGWQSCVLNAVYLGGSNLFLSVGLAIGMALNYLSADYGISLLTLLAFAAMYPLGIGFVFAMRRKGAPKGEAGESDGRRSGGGAAAGGSGAAGHETGVEQGSLFNRAASAQIDAAVPVAANDIAAAGRALASNDAAANGTAARSDLRSGSGAVTKAGTGTGAGAGAGAAVSPDNASSTERGAVTEPDWESALARFSKRYALTKRESEICSYLVRGRSAKHIAEALFISENTVWTHAKNVYGKTKVSGKDELINLFEKEAGR